ncbi:MULTISPECIES: DNA repair protein RecN [Vagococcus]|uniref:DNA repair protein RecN n=1 Tax=Vagococcus fluvialis bH819 TaxID=1255619 RepID=A0A1X6WMB3_9ENTE|nr:MULTISPECIES: DNA repair protein RecN [Vagococcus]SLM85372.1 DNA repair protein RecN [Vagococcus fluvialis bH819]HCM89332.1 DNA repair protein RecN [Vagococcus sp.]
MIQELSVQDFAIISNLNIEFKEGMTVLTGETGAGKSIIIDAMGLIVGGRGSSDFIRDGAEKCRIEGSFYIENKKEIAVYLENHGIEMVDDLLIVQREIYRTGRNNCRINGQLVNTKTLREIGQFLVDIHGQNEHQELMDASHHLSLLDHFDPERLTPLLEEYQQHFHKFKEIELAVKKFYANEKEYVQRMDMLQFQFEEIDRAELIPDEEDQLLEERKKLVSFQQITDALKNTYHVINGEDSQTLDLVAQAMNEMSSIEHLDASYKETSELIQTSYYSLQEASNNVSALVDDLELDESRLLEVEGRLDVIRQLKRKYGETVEKVLEYFEFIKEELSLSEIGDFDIEVLEQEMETEKNLVDSLGEQLSGCRMETAKGLEENILVELKSLFMENTRFEVKFTPLDKPNEYGVDKIEFFISTNLGEELKPLVKVASGGELSRVMLAIKTIFSKNHGMTSIVFDEVDTGVSGRVAQAIAEKIHQIGMNSQVLCITHLPQVAAIADTQYFIKKEIKNKRTETSVSELASDERIDEVARMLSGSEITPLTLEHAKELLAIAQKK